MINITTLSNGFRIATDYIPHVETASIGIWVKCGARKETVETNGIAHFLEHMAFKGTATRTAKEIAESIESVGGYLNAYTSREATAYYAHVMKEDAPLALDILQDILNNSTFDPEEMEKEREVILQELGQSYDTPDDIIFDYFQETAFPNQSMGRPILGPASNIKSFDRNMIAKFMADHYCPSRMVLAAAGNIDHDALCKLAEGYFGTRKVLTHEDPAPSVYTGGHFYENRTLEQAHVVIGMGGVSSHNSDYYTMNIYSGILGDGMSSRLFQEIREKRGLVYSIYSFHSSYSDTGTFGVYAGCDPQRVPELIPAALNELKQFPHTLTADEIRKAKNQSKARLTMSMESTSGRCQRLANQLLIFDRAIPLNEIAAKIESVTQADIAELSSKILHTPAILTALGKDLSLPSVDDISVMLRG
ncbi:M16 family metallopeptidase [Candidatus Bodocaedibacter vickermanii]|uniref:Putative zinc protease n=1 Tax=Candidatus Bodocaedibacter vickermanii TaxID=2741701 RepID=A0A7L9RU96_9PROT|nr:putative zinc protease [Candidatus Paracaedibacteraceae bacterium 'Lake Konstanz']